MRNRFLQRFLLGLATTTLLLIATTAHSEVLLFEEWRNDFLGLGPDSQPDIGEGVYYQGGHFSNVLDLSSGQLWMKMDDRAPNDGYLVEYVPRRENRNASTYQLDYEINSLPGLFAVGRNAFQTSLAFGPNSLEVTNADDGLIYVQDGAGFVSTGYAYTPGTPLDVSLTADTTSDTYNLSINGNWVLRNQPANSNLEGRPEVRFSSNYDSMGAHEISYVELNDDYEAPNLLSNGSFELGLNQGHSTFLEGTGPGISSATNWTLFHNNLGSTESTRVPAETVPERLPGSGNSLMRIEASHERNGLVQVFGDLNTGPAIVESSVWVYVESGNVSLGTGNGGNTGVDATSTTTGRWEKLTSRNGIWPANELILYADGGSSLFYADLARVEVIATDLTIGDANLDGLFNSSDLVTVFTAGRYETGTGANWEAGDWTGDGLFDSSDLVAAFRSGTYLSLPQLRLPCLSQHRCRPFCWA